MNEFKVYAKKKLSTKMSNRPNDIQVIFLYKKLTISQPSKLRRVITLLKSSCLVHWVIACVAILKGESIKSYEKPKSLYRKSSFFLKKKLWKTYLKYYVVPRNLNTTAVSNHKNSNSYLPEIVILSPCA